MKQSVEEATSRARLKYTGLCRLFHLDEWKESHLSKFMHEVPFSLDPFSKFLFGWLYHVIGFAQLMVLSLLNSPFYSTND